ncbi:unnamed protein product [Ambrosiozyma monospora]|uniref:Unnamed protein product n=1 Tax=Ambrosiozyma monospora TaxID=43982 RepID=A0A9W6Z4M7_AMBMO|nr:unnamed protein product [Ambrosiozyma monospora]
MTPSITDQAEQPLLATDDNGKSSKTRLYTYNEVPEWQKDNHFILTGYVKETNSLRECIRSLFYLHNESVNVLSHLLPGSVLPLALVLIVGPLFLVHTNTNNLIKYLPSWLFEIPIYPETTTSTDKLIFHIFFSGFITCLSCSAVFHLMKSHSLKVSVFGNQLDYVGIIALIVTSMIGIIFYGFRDNLTPMHVSLGLVCTLGSICLCVTLIPQFKENKWRPFRATMFVIFGLSSVFPIGYGLWLYGVSETFARTGLMWVLLEGLGYCSGAFIYAARVPERFSPGTFDIFGHSHQIFHVLVVISAYFHFKGLIEAYKYCHENLSW